MGDYTGIALHLQFPKTTSEQLKAFLDETFNQRKEFNTNLPAIIDDQSRINAEELDNLYLHLFCSSAYFQGWEFSLFKFHSDFNCYIVEARSSIKAFRHRTELLVEFLSLMKPHLLLHDGQIIARSIYEYDTAEEVIYFNTESNSLKVGKGYSYPEGDRDPNHPTYMWSEFGASGRDSEGYEIIAEFNKNGYSALGFIPPLNIGEYDKSLLSNPTAELTQPSPSIELLN